MVTNDALERLFMQDNQTLADQIDANYFTIATWRHAFNNGKLSEEKKAEILQKFNYKLKSERKWQRLRKA